MAKAKKKGNKIFKKEKVITNEATYTEAEIEAFLEECGKKPMFKISDFKDTLEKEVESLSYKDTRILISKVGWLSDDERERYRDVIVFEALTAEEEERYRRIYPNPIKFGKYFPSKEVKQ